MQLSLIHDLSFMNVFTFHGSWNMALNFQNEWLLPSLPPFFVLSFSLFLFSSVFMLVRLLFRDVSETLPLVYFPVNGSQILWALCCFSFHLLSGERSCYAVSHMDSGHRVKMDAPIGDIASGLWQSSLLMSLKVTNECKGLFKVSMVRGNPGRNVLDPHTICSARALGVWVWRWNVCTGEEPFTRWLCK